MSRGERVLIVNADDLGRTSPINEATFYAHERGVVTSATLMVGFPAAEHAARRLADYPELGVGLHVTLTGAPPTLPARDLPSLVDARGLLPRNPDGLTGANREEIRAEVRHQLRLFRQLTGREPTHFDSHHHSHRVPEVLDALVELARETRLPVRNASPAVGARLRAEGIATTDAFVERFFAAEATLPVLLEIFAQLGPGVTEVMCHPGLAHDPELAAASTYVDDRVRELEVLTHEKVRAAIDQLGLVRAHFGTACGS